jgi:hypothetical protein
VSELTGVSARTIQHWRKTGFFVPAIRREELTRFGYAPGEIYSLGDVFAVKVIDILRVTSMRRDALEKISPALSLWWNDGTDWYSPREFNAEYEWEPKETRGEFWWTVPLAEFGDESDDTGKSWPRWWYESELREHGLPSIGRGRSRCRTRSTVCRRCSCLAT